jgi:hypothetical protein
MIDRSTIFRQVRHDLFGSKDAQDASSLTYTWVADQFGHVTLGFIATLFLWAVLPIEWAAIVVAIAILIKEAYDYFYEFDRRQGAFPFDRNDVLLNCATSCIYTWIGTALAVIAVHFPLWSLLAAVVLVALSLPLAEYWLRLRCSSRMYRSYTGLLTSPKTSMAQMGLLSSPVSLPSPRRSFGTSY